MPRQLQPGLIDALFALHGIREPWIPLPTAGVANHIYATHDIVLRIATDHVDAVPDARTESVAAPAARAAGIRTPRLVAFDDSRALVDRPWSLWERVHGETLGMLAPEPDQLARAWHDIGRELARLHDRVTACPDPNGYLDTPGRPLDLAIHLERVRIAGLVDRRTGDAMSALIRQLEPHLAHSGPVRFVHDDVHPWNVMCTREGDLLALIDWGDAGWGDPTLDFVHVPLELIPSVVEAYESESSTGLGTFPEARFVWDKLWLAVGELIEGHGSAPPVETLQRFVDGGR